MKVADGSNWFKGLAIKIHLCRYIVLINPCPTQIKPYYSGTKAFILHIHTHTFRRAAWNSCHLFVKVFLLTL